MTLRHNSFQNDKYAAFNDNQFLDYHFYQAVHCKRNNSSSSLQNSLPVGQSLLFIEALPYHTQTQHTRWDFSGRVVRPTHIPLRDNTQYWQEKDLHVHGGVRTHNPSE
jgi:hypothetical protein